jgi:inner membrane protein
MDSLTQAALGATVGHLCWQQQLGRKALLVGGLLGTLPDLDIILYPFLDDVQRLYWHRGESHSLWFVVFGALLVGWILRRLSVSGKLTPVRAVIGVLLIFATHILIDLFNVYGTQILAPLSRQGFAISNMYIIDPLFTLPLLAGIFGALLAKNREVAKWLNRGFLLVAALYACWSITAQQLAREKFNRALAQQDLQVSAQTTSAGAFTTLLWRHIARTPDGFLLGYWSVFDPLDAPIDFVHIPQHPESITAISEARNFKAVSWFSKGWWFVAESDGQSARVVDLRFSEIPSAKGQRADQWDWPFAWEFSLDQQEENSLKALQPEIANPAVTFSLLGRRVLGKEGWLVGNLEK